MVATATLPESNEAMLLSSRAEEAIRQADYRLALELIDRTRMLADGLVAAPASRTYHPVWRHAQRLLEQLPPAGIDLYRNLYEGDGGAPLEAAPRASDIGKIRQLFRTYAVSSHWPEVARELASLLLDVGDYAEAVEVLRELHRAAPDDLVSAAQLAAALALGNAPDAANRVMQELPSAAGAPDAVRAVASWLGARAVERAGAFAPRLDGALEWAVELDPVGADTYRERDEDVALAINAERKLPLVAPAVADDVLVVRCGGRLHALDLWTLTPRWVVSEIGAPASLRGQVGRRALRVSGTDTIEISLETELVLTHALRYGVSAGGGLALSVEGLQLEVPMPQRRFGVPAARPAVSTNEVVARELSSGRIVWRVGAEAGSPLFGSVFQTAPLILGDVCAVAYERKGELRVALLNLSDGGLRCEAVVVAPPTRFTAEGGRVLLAADESRIFVSTGNGVVAALARRDLAWHWATTYPSTLGNFLGRMWWQPETPVVESGVDPLVASGDLLIAAPMDTTDIYAFDRFSGRERWHAPRGEHTFVVGASGGGLIVGGYGLASLDLADGRTLRWKSVPLDICGRPTIRAGKIYAPTRLGLVAIDAETGKVVEDPGFSIAPEMAASAREARRPLAANLLALGDMLLLVSPNRVVKLPDVEAARARSAAEGAGGPAKPDRQLSDAWLAALTGDYAAALQRLREIDSPEARVRRARDDLWARVCTALAGAAATDQERLAWLEEAATAASDPRDAARLAALIGQTLARAGQVQAAIEHYERLLLKDDEGALAPVDDGLLAQAAPLLALRQTAALLASMSAEQARQRTDRLIELAATGDNRLLALLAPLVRDDAQRRRIDRLMTLRKAAPELAAAHLADDDAALPAGERRRLTLERWDVHVALGRLAPARREASLWAELAGSAGPAEIQPAELDRVELIRNAQEKLARALAPPFGDEVTRVWKATDAQMVVRRDLPEPITGGVLLRSTAESRLDLHHLVRGISLRQEPARLVKDSNLSPERVESRRPALSADVQWPAVFHGHLVAIPVPGGLVCRGLGIERYGGYRIWERGVPEWIGVPREFAATAAATEHGLCYAPRADRLVCVDWHAGRVLWQRDLPDRRVERVLSAGTRVVVLTSDNGLLSMDALFGDELRTARLDGGIEAVGATLVVWDASGLSGLDPQTLRPRWTTSDGAVDRPVFVSGQPWVAYRKNPRGGWTVLNAADGAALLTDCLPDVAQIDAWVRLDTGQAIVAGRGEPRPRMLLLRPLGGACAQPEWAAEVPTRIAPTPSQLAAHPERIPILVLRSAGSGEGVDRRTLALQTVSRRDGSVSPPLQIDTYFPDSPGPGPAHMICTESRMIVQAYASVVALGAWAGASP